MTTYHFNRSTYTATILVVDRSDNDLFAEPLKPREDIIRTGSPGWGWGPHATQAGALKAAVAILADATTDEDAVALGLEFVSVLVRLAGNEERLEKSWVRKWVRERTLRAIEVDTI